ncbi:MAG: cupin domain-containing protein [Candidatus Binatia bacterium]
MTTRQKSYIDGPASGIRHSQDMPWIPFPGIEGSHFKLLRLDRETDGGIFLLRIQPGVRGPLHKHFGSVEYYNLEGTLDFGKVKMGPGSYAYELGGFKHSEEPPTEETITLFIVHGPLQAYQPDGTPGRVLGATAMAKLQEQYMAEQQAVSA